MTTRAGQRMWGWDVEASDPDRPWDGATLAVVSSEEGDEERFIGPDCLERVAAHMQKARGTYCAHYGGGYDVPLLLNHWRPKRLVLSGSVILLAEDSADLRLRDTFPWWLSSLKKVGEAVGEKKFDVDRAQMERMTLQEQADYCAQDVRVELKGVAAARTFMRSLGAKEAWTAGQSAASIVRAVEPGTWRALERNRCDVDDVMEFLASGACRAGRIECGARGIVENVYCYDVKSSYPARYAHDDVGVGLRHAVYPQDKNPDQIGVHLCRWRWLDRRRVPPALDSRTMCGVGDCEAWLTNDEVRRFEQCGIKLTFVEGWCPQEVLPVAQAFARLMFDAKEGTGPERFFSKVWLNAWLGKTAMSPLREHFTSWHPREYWAPGGVPKPVPEGPHGAWWHRYYTIDHDKEKKCKAYQQPLLAAIGFGRARAALWDIDDAVYNAGWPVLYNDTDSLFTTCPPDRMPIPLGTGLGELAFDGGPYTGYFLGPKAYLLVDEHGAVKKCALKGVPHRSYADGIFDPSADKGAGVFREARGVERVKGSGVFSRKGIGRDVRVQLFERALGAARNDTRSTDYGAARCVKDGLSTFLRGIRGVDEEGPGRWKRAPVTRTVRPSGRGKIHHTPSSFEYLAVVEVSMMKYMRTLPAPESRDEKFSVAAVELARKLGHVYVDPDARAYASLPREEITTASGKRVRRLSLWLTYRELLEGGGVVRYNGEEADRMVRAQHIGRGDGPGPWHGGEGGDGFELEAFHRELGHRKTRSPFEGFFFLCRRASLWRDIVHATPVLRDFPGFEKVRVPAELAHPSRNLVKVTTSGAAWLARVSTVWDPADDDTNAEGFDLTARADSELSEDD